ncbi:MAG: ParB N-terminal domain-containing protein [Paracoccaceae bacterium]
MTQIQHIPLAEIDEHALPRDRSVIDSAALDELTASIRAGGLRLPVELFATVAGYGLLSGYRRLMAFRRLEELHGQPYAAIPALIRPAADLLDSFARVVEENDIRQGLTPGNAAAPSWSPERWAARPWTPPSPSSTPPPTAARSPASACSAKSRTRWTAGSTPPKTGPRPA